MEKRKKLQLQKIEVKSFVTMLNEQEVKEIRGGSEVSPEVLGTTIIRIFC
ncbi:MAG: pinensin family lanthipeptide [Candidatus Aminicenantes bacterium]|nr:pinensin family lanthipeptide [Candidatus Aminicenantes bacterium]